MDRKIIIALVVVLVILVAGAAFFMMRSGNNSGAGGNGGNGASAPPPPPSAFRFQSENYPDRYWGIGGGVNLDSIPASQTAFNVVPGLCGVPGYISFQSKEDAGKYLRHAGNNRMQLLANDQSAEFKAASCYKEVPGLCGTADHVSYASQDMPNAYIRHAGHIYWTHPSNNTTLFNRDACFKKVQV